MNKLSWKGDICPMHPIAKEPHPWSKCHHNPSSLNYWKKNKHNKMDKHRNNNNNDNNNNKKPSQTTFKNKEKKETYTSSTKNENQCH